jgi:hypothetical protein
MFNECGGDVVFRRSCRPSSYVVQLTLLRLSEPLSLPGRVEFEIGAVLLLFPLLLCDMRPSKFDRRMAKWLVWT